jgi:flagellar biosynthetic protein FliR
VEVPLAQAWAFALVLLRTLGLLLGAPIVGARNVPARLKLGLGAGVAFAAYAGAGAPAAAAPATLFALAGAAVSETGLGLLAGLGARLVLHAAVATGQLVAVATGIGFGSLVDPTSGAESNALGELLHVLAQAGAVALGLHREAIAWLARSLHQFPPGAPPSLRDAALRVVTDATGVAALSVRLGFPILAAVLAGHLAMAVTGRMAPQLSLSHVGFSLALLAAGAAFWLAAPAAAAAVAQLATAAMARG